jgi:Histidine kinase-, DNA gyrase B-, and HSP90-like ATPase
VQLAPAATVTVSSGGTNHDTVPCGFDPEGTAHLMRVLSNLYRNAAAAVVREYSANAFDSHVDAGNPGPIEVTLPTDLNPTLVITDHGTGLSRDQMIRVYSRYGASTKRGTNDQVGAFGLGTKSAFTLGHQFIVTANKDGWRTVAAFGLDTTGTGTVTIVDHEPTGHGNGVTVAICVDDPGAVQRAAGPVFATWRPGTVLVDGQQPRSILDDSLEVADGIYLAVTAEQDAAAWGDAGLIVVMGNIGYPVSHGLREKLRGRLRHREARTLNPLLTAHRDQRTFAFLGIGDTDIAPSREEMRDTPRTMDRLVRVAEEYCDGIAALVQREIDNSPTLTAAARTAAALSRRPHLTGLLDRARDLSWRGQRVAAAIAVPYPSSEYSPGQHRCSHERGGFRLGLNDGSLDSTLVVTGVPDGGQESAMRAARSFLAGESTWRRLVFAPVGAQPVQWFAFGEQDTLPALPFTGYLAQARRHARAATPRTTEVIRYLTVTSQAGEQQMTAEQIAALSVPVVVAGGLDELTAGAMRYPAFAQRVRDGVAITILSGGRTAAALQRRLGQGVPVISLTERARAVAAAVAVSISDNDLEAERLHACAVRTSEQLLGALAGLRGQITNRAVTAVLDRPAGSSAQAQLLAGAREQQPGLLPAAAAQASLTEQFPLLVPIQYHARLDARTAAHVVVYLNALDRQPTAAD